MPRTLHRRSTAQPTRRPLVPDASAVKNTQHRHPDGTAAGIRGPEEVVQLLSNQVSAADMAAWNCPSRNGARSVGSSVLPATRRAATRPSSTPAITANHDSASAVGANAAARLTPSARTSYVAITAWPSCVSGAASSSPSKTEQKSRAAIAASNSAWMSATDFGGRVDTDDGNVVVVAPSSVVVVTSNCGGGPTRSLHPLTAPATSAAATITKDPRRSISPAWS